MAPLVLQCLSAFFCRDHNLPQKQTIRYLPLLASLLFLISTPGFSQQPKSDPQAVSFASQSMSALTNGVAISDVTLTGTVTWTVGSDSEAGTATLLALGTGESRMNLSLQSGTRSEIRDASTGIALGQWINQSGASGLFASQNCWTDAVWFFPALGSLAMGPNVVLSYIGADSWYGHNAQHIESYIYLVGQSLTTPTPQQLSTMDFYLDATTLLPLGIMFNGHPDNNAGANTQYEIDFLSYQAIGGVNVPTHVQKYIQGSLVLDLSITAASFNTGVPLSDFAINN
jgi:hypothetical protein